MDEFVTLSAVLGFVASLITLTVWLWRLINKIHMRIAKARALADQGKWLAQQMVEGATSSEKRADIYLYLTLRAIEFSERRTNASIENGMLGAGTLLLIPVFAWSFGRFELDYSHPLVILFYVAFTGLVVALGVTIWLERNLRMLESGWEAGVRDVLIKKVDKHVSQF